MPDSIAPAPGTLTRAPHDAAAREAWQQRGGVPETPQELNRYAYARNNPLRYTDPTGHCVGGSVWQNVVSVFDGTCVRKGLVILAHARTPDEWALGAFAAFGPPTAAALLTAGTFGFAAAALLTAGTFGFAAAAPGVVAAVGTGAETTAATVSPWSLPPLERGQVIDERMLGRSSFLSHNFPVIDRFENGVATSIKSIDLHAARYQNLTTLTRTVERCVTDLANWQGAAWGGAVIDPSKIKAREVLLAIPPGTSQTQLTALQNLQQWATSQGVALNLVVVP